MSTPDTAGFRILGLTVRPQRLIRGGPPLWAWLGALLTIYVLSAWAWRHQWPTTEGLAVTAMRDAFAWGFYIQNFVYLVGLSAGGLIIYSSVVLFGAKEFAPLQKLAVLQAGVCVLLAMLFILPDLGNPQRVWWFFVTPNLRSIFVFDAMVLTLYLLLCAFDLWALLSGWAHKGQRELILTLVSLATAVGVHSITAWVLGFVRGRDLWHTALMAPLFISSAVASGLGLLIVLAAALRRVQGWRLKDSMFERLGFLLLIVVLIDLFFMGSELLTTYWPSSRIHEHSERMDLLLDGQYAPLLFVQLVVGGAVPALLLFVPRWRARTPVVVLAAVLVAIGVFAKRAVLLVMGFGFSPLGSRGDYLPSLFEVVVSAGVYAMGALIITVLLLVLDLSPTAEVPAHDASIG